MAVSSSTNLIGLFAGESLDAQMITAGVGFGKRRRKEKKGDLIAKIISLQMLIEVRDGEAMRLREEVLRLIELVEQIPVRALG
jgi:hypothetical protein